MTRISEVDCTVDSIKGKTAQDLEPCDSKCTRPINEHKEIQLVFSGLDLRDIKMKELNRIAFEALSLGLVF